MNINTFNNLNKKELIKLELSLNNEINLLLQKKKKIQNKLNNTYDNNTTNNINININININNSNIKNKCNLTVIIIKKSLNDNNIKYSKNMNKEELYNLLKKHKIVKYTYNLFKEYKETIKKDRTYTEDSDEEN